MYSSPGRTVIVASVTAAAVITATLLGPPAPASADSPPDQELRPGHSFFWDGEMVESSGPENHSVVTALAETGTAACTDPAQLVFCREYTLEVAEGGHELRVAIDHPAAADYRNSMGLPPGFGGPSSPAHLDHFGLELRGPDNTVVTDDGQNPFPDNANYSTEARARPALGAQTVAPGTWTVTVIAYRARSSDFRMRAYLAPTPPDAPNPPVPLYPNLQANPPFELSFSDCTDSESPAVHCLRFAQGPNNVGDGPLDLMIIGPATPDADGHLRAPEYQCIHYTDGTSTCDVPGQAQPIGYAEYHDKVGHMHYHHPGTGHYELFAANPSTRTVTPVNDGPKQGFCMGDYLIADWESFNQDPHRTLTEYFTLGSCGAELQPVVKRMGLTAGWGDVYPGGVEGNYVEFTPEKDPNMLPDGRYVIRATTNPCPDDNRQTGRSCHGSLVESQYGDNAAYTYFQVITDAATGTPTIIEIERGRGISPFDPDKEIVNDNRRFLFRPDPVRAP